MDWPLVRRSAPGQRLPDQPPIDRADKNVYPTLPAGEGLATHERPEGVTRVA